MKIKTTALFAALFMSAGFVFAATNDLSSLLQRGLLEEEANHNFEAAMRDYQAAIDGFDQDRQLAATAVFRLGECLRKSGKTNEAGIQYERVLREFPDQTNLARLCSDYLGGSRTANLAAGGPDAKLQQNNASYNEIMLKWSLAEGELATVTNLSKQEQEKYFTTFKRDSSLVSALNQRLGAEQELRRLQGLGYGSNNPAYVSGQRLVTAFNESASNQIETLIWGLQKEAQVLHNQVDALRVRLAQAGQPVAADSSSALSAAPTTATSAEDEEVRKIREMIRNSPDLINAPTAQGITPLQSSVRAGNIAAAELLLANGANVNGTGRGGMFVDGDDTPLSLAADRGNKGMIELLLAKGADVNAADRNSQAWTPLHHAVAKGFKSTAEVLIAHKADVNARRSDGSTPLHEAASRGFSAVAELLIANGANVNAALNNGETPLFEAVQNNRPETVQLLLSNKAQVNFTNSAGETPLFQAVRNNHPDMVQLLLSNKAEVNLTNSAGDTPLIAAVRNNWAEIVPLLLANKAQVNARDKTGYTPLHLAVLDNQPELVKLLLSNKADVNAATDIGITPLLFAVARSDADSSGQRQPGPRAPEMPGAASMPGPPPGMPGMTPIPALRQPYSPPSPALGYAATNLVEILLENGANTQAHIKEGGGSWGYIVPGIHALDLAIESGRSDVTELLLAAHADPNARYASSDYSGTPLLWSLHWLNRLPDWLAKELKPLLDHGADPNLADGYGRTPLSIMASENFLNLDGALHVKLLQELLDHHADPNKPDDRGLPPLAYVQNDEVRAVLLKAGANEDYQRLARIFIAQKGTGSLGQEVFYKGTNSVNHYTLLETVAEAWEKGNINPPVGFPDFAHVVINRLKAGGGKEEIAVNLDEILTNGDFSKDMPLEWGDVVQIPQRDHLLNEMAVPLPPAYREALRKCLQRQVQIIVKGQTTKLKLLPPIANSRIMIMTFNPQDLGLFDETPRNANAGTPSATPVEKTLYTFLLDEVVHEANVLLLSSDLSRVKVTRHGVDMQYNLDELEARAGRRGGGGGRGGGGSGGPVAPMGLGARFGGGGGGSASNNNSPDLWLRDGDIIEIPERDPNAPLAK